MLMGDRADLGLVDLVLVVHLAAVADQDRASDFLVQHEAHLGLQPGNDVERRDVDDVITVQLLLLVDGGGPGLALGDAEELLLLHVALDVTLRSGGVEGDVGRQRLDARERRLPGTRQNGGDPLHLPRDELGRAVERLGVREQQVDVVDAVGTGVLEERLPERAALLRVDHDGLHLRVGEGGAGLNTGGRSRAFEDVAGHVVVSFQGGVLDGVVGIGGVGVLGAGLIGAVKRLTDHEVDDVLLLFAEGFEDVLDGLFAGAPSVCVLELELGSGVNDGLLGADG